MEKVKNEEVTRLLQKAADCKRLRLPSQIQFDIKDDVLSVMIEGEGVIKNMQTDTSAFEGWIVCLKAYINGIQRVVLNWNDPCYNVKEEYRKREEKHYNRFLMRAALFEKSYGWFSIDDSRRVEIDRCWEAMSKLVLNYPKSQADKTAQKEEANLEREIVAKMGPIADHQLPVGLFSGSLIANNAFTPRAASQIDIWQLNGDELSIYELKADKNKAVGIISELMFYANAMRLFVNHVIDYPTEFAASETSYRHAKELYDWIRHDRIKKINAVFLTNALHPLIEKAKEKILQILNEPANKTGICFAHEEVSKYTQR